MCSNGDDTNGDTHIDRNATEGETQNDRNATDWKHIMLYWVLVLKLHNATLGITD